MTEYAIGVKTIVIAVEPAANACDFCTHVPATHSFALEDPFPDTEGWKACGPCAKDVEDRNAKSLADRHVEANCAPPTMSKAAARKYMEREAYAFFARKPGEATTLPA